MIFFNIGLTPTQLRGPYREHPFLEVYFKYKKLDTHTQKRHMPFERLAQETS